MGRNTPPKIPPGTPALLFWGPTHNFRRGPPKNRGSGALTGGAQKTTAPREWPQIRGVNTPVSPPLGKYSRRALFGKTQVVNPNPRQKKYPRENPLSKKRPPKKVCNLTPKTPGLKKGPANPQEPPRRVKPRRPRQIKGAPKPQTAPGAPPERMGNFNPFPGPKGLGPNPPGGKSKAPPPKPKKMPPAVLRPPQMFKFLAQKKGPAGPPPVFWGPGQNSGSPRPRNFGPSKTGGPVKKNRGFRPNRPRFNSFPLGKFSGLPLRPKICPRLEFFSLFLPNPHPNSPKSFKFPFGAGRQRNWPKNGPKKKGKMAKIWPRAKFPGRTGQSPHISKFFPFFSISGPAVQFSKPNQNSGPPDPEKLSLLGPGKTKFLGPRAAGLPIIPKIALNSRPTLSPALSFSHQNQINGPGARPHKTIWERQPG